MVVLNCYGKIDKICISTKLGLYLSNLPDSPENNWKEQLEKELKLSYDADRIYQEYLGTKGIVEEIQRQGLADAGAER